jgi:uncharacterized protein YidB (DUF937 family)
MGLFDTLVSGLEASDAQHAALFAEVQKLVDESGGVAGLQQKFEAQGMSGVIEGWIGAAGNPPASGAQVTQAVGPDKIADIAAKTGVPQDQVATVVAQMLPLIVSHLTPGGTVPPHDSGLLDAAMGELKTKLLG